MLKRRSSPSVRSGSNRSRSHSRVSNGTMMQVKRKLSNTSVTGPRRKMKRSDSEKKKVMEKKLLSYYQSLVKDCNDYSPPCLGSEQMLDGTDVDMQITKKRTHKNIFAEAFAPSNPGNKLGLQATEKPDSSGKNDSKASGTGNRRERVNETGFRGPDGEANGYILEAGNIIAIDQPRLQAVNRFALDVIKVQVSDHFEKLNEGEDGDFNKLKGNLMSILEKNAMKPVDRKQIAQRLSVQPENIN